MYYSNLPIIIAVFLSYRTFAYGIPPTFVNSPNNNESRYIETGNTFSLAGRQSTDPAIQSQPPASHSEFAKYINSPLIIVCLVLLVISLTVISAVFYRVRRTRRRLRDSESQKTPLPSRRPSIYIDTTTPSGSRTRTRSRSLSITNVLLSPVVDEPRPPSPALTISSVGESDFQSSDIHYVQRELGTRISVYGPVANNASSPRPVSRAMSRKSRHRGTIGPVRVWIGPQYASLWDVEVGRWRQSNNVWM
ncbi:hypothetical protein R3P38DRAFT_1312019 [Favolaschia claudopus]|uniref:Transmembrane protein n=1 Tax=Favolaschia claudopus TaxID=2862362 RepID=A0AAW0AWS9_9AGAR